jgi:hypothetical protein
MPCTHVELRGGGHAIVCGGRRKPKLCECGRVGTLLCDWKMGGGKTCARPMCSTHASEVGPDKHLCAEHKKAFDAWPDARK